jgi:hypothetical protein
LAPHPHGVDLLVGQTITLNLQMAPSTLQGRPSPSPVRPPHRNAVLRTQSNIDPRQVQDLPTAGRNWMSLALLAPATTPALRDRRPLQDRVDVREFR